MNPVPNFTIACLLVGLLYVNVISADKQQQAYAANSPPMRMYDPKTGERNETLNYGGLFHIHTYYNTTQLKDKLKLHKSYVKLVVKSDHLPAKIKAAIKFSELEELVRCADLNLIRPEMESLVECEQQVKSNSTTNRHLKQQQTSATFVRRRSVWLKDNFGYLTFNQVQKEFRLYPLQAYFTRESVRMLLNAANMSQGLGFDRQMELITGHYFEIDLMNEIACSGNVFQVVNQSKPLVRNPADTDAYPEFYDLFVHSNYEMIRNGGLLSFQDVSCGRQSGFMSSVTLDIDFTLIRRLQFPYWFCSHKMAMQPMAELFSYDGQIRQFREEDSPLNTYSAMVRIQSKSVFPRASFQVNQTFVMEDEHTGKENMSLIHPNLLAIVNANWTLDSFIKVLTLEAFSDDKPLGASGDLTKPDVMFMWVDIKEDDYVNFTIRLKRELLKTLIELVQATSASTGETDAPFQGVHPRHHKTTLSSTNMIRDVKVPRIEL